jgi:hypothetical protein
MARWFSTQLVLLFLLFTLMGCGMVWLAATGRSGPGWAFTALWFAALLSNAYWWLWRVGMSLEIADGNLVWRTMLRSGSRPIVDIASVRPSRLRLVVMIFEFADGHRVLAMTGAGFRSFLDDLAQRAPGVPIQNNWTMRRLERRSAGRYWRDP